MNRDYCIFKASKKCDNCGECEICDLNRSKKCNNCGKCMQLEGYDIKSIKIDEIIEDEEEVKEYEKEITNDSNSKITSENHYQFSEGDSESGRGEVSDDAEETAYIDDDYVNSDYDEYTYDDTDDIDENLVFIDDVEGLSEILEDDGRLSELTYEEFPGVLRFKTEKDFRK
ncbi:hypothetical protein N4T77_02520 [Clostridium sp. CX1]|uniref:Zn-finger domain-containing protein n=1 Tax=Clostridium tanneri TaxID=3037988 RepID=A0ABU4JUV3_9CLOT|nr:MULTISPECIES: hypothetical protein [unclassified Clostridium]MCT8975464.1 hypothetical protein [Clostridium sp. CX1]MDW8801930.1 hypothetical protein [Clostridium sp. A1-XYC3]